MSNKFCRYLTNGLRVQSWHGNLVASPCCYLPLERIYSPEFNKKIEEYNSLKSCDACKWFVQGNTDDPNYPPNRSHKIIQDVEHTHPVYAELSIDDLCNAACLSCSDAFSTYWAKQNEQFNIKPARTYPIVQKGFLVESLFGKFNFAHLTTLNFLGGEPLISPIVLLVLERLIEMGVAKNIEVIFTTNGSTRLTDHQIEILNQFRSVVLSYSIDGIGDKFHYLRYPLKWEKVVSVVEQAIQLSSFKNSHIIVNMTISALSAFYIDEVLDWASEILKSNGRKIDFKTPECGGVMSVRALPLEARLYLKEKYKDKSRYGNLTAMFLDDPTNQESVVALIEYLNTWDKNRKSDWKSLFPEAVPYFLPYLID